MAMSPAVSDDEGVNIAPGCRTVAAAQRDEKVPYVRRVAVAVSVVVLGLPV